MLTRKKFSENVNPLSRVVGPKKVAPEGPVKCEPAKLKKITVGQTKRAAFGDITNATNETTLQDKKKIPVPIKSSSNTSLTIAFNKTNKPIVKKKVEIKRKAVSQVCLSQRPANASNVSSNTCKAPSLKSSLPVTKQAPKIEPAEVVVDRIEEDFSFITEETEVKQEVSGHQEVAEESLLAVDVENYTDVFNVGIYAQHIFDYYKCREKLFRISPYLADESCRVTPVMRAILIDWMVEVQENFELNHETLYLAVKLTDLYLSRVTIDKEILQLVGAVSIFIASKFDERCPPLIDDFIFICDNAFERDQFISMEMEILKTVDFDLGIPISYTFLRRYAKVARMSLETLTLARFILEMSLMEYDLITSRDSMMAAAALYIAQKMRKEGSWDGDVVKSSGYSFEDIKEIIVALNKMLHIRPIPQLSTIRSKYSHQIFHEVAKIALLPTEELLNV